MPGSASNTRRGTSSVRELLAPLRLRSGATTVTSASVARASRSRRMPSARKPSSLLIRIFNWGSLEPPQVRLTILEDGYRAQLAPRRCSVAAAGDDEAGDESDEARLFRDAVRGVRP